MSWGHWTSWETQAWTVAVEVSFLRLVYRLLQRLSRMSKQFDATISLAQLSKVCYSWRYWTTTDLESKDDTEKQEEEALAEVVLANYELKLTVWCLFSEKTLKLAKNQRIWSPSPGKETHKRHERYFKSQHTEHVKVTKASKKKRIELRDQCHFRSTEESSVKFDR